MTAAHLSPAPAPTKAPSSRDVLDALPLHLATVDSRGVVIETNRAWSDFGFPPSGRLLFSAWEGDTVEALARSTLRLGVGAVLEGTRERFEIEYPLRRSDETVWLALAAHRQNEGAVVSQDDVTGRRRHRPLAEVEERSVPRLDEPAPLALETAHLVDQLGEVSRLKSEFVATVSHELRTPIHVVLGFADLVLEGEFGELNDGLRDAMKRILFGARSLMELSEATLQLTRLDEGPVPIERADVPLAEVFEEAEAEVRATQRDAKIPIELRLAPGLETARTDRAKLKLILKNLLDNGVKFTEHGRVTATIRRTNDDLEIVVEDTGVGIDEDALPSIFDAFRQADGSMTRRHGGVGLGLHLVRRTVESLGGTIRAGRASPGGARFEITLPMGELVE